MKKNEGYAGSISNCGAQIVKAPLAKTGKGGKNIANHEGDGRK